MTGKNSLGLLALGSAACLTGLVSCNSGKEQQPNIIFIICDDLNDAITGYGGHPQALTPNIDRMVSRGVRFINAQNNDPVSGPSRASLITGLYPHTSGYFGYDFNHIHWRTNPVLKKSLTFFDFFVHMGIKSWVQERFSIIPRRNGPLSMNTDINPAGDPGPGTVHPIRYIPSDSLPKPPMQHFTRNLPKAFS